MEIKEVIVIKRQSKVLQGLLYELANILCWFRIVVSVLLAVMTEHHLVLAVLFALAFVSDVLDGWCYRKFTKGQPYRHWFNELPLTLDPIADFVLVGGGFVHVMDEKPVGFCCVLVLALLMIGWNWLARRSTDQMYTLLMTGLTYFWFFMMTVTMFTVWQRNAGEYWLIGAIMTETVFYLLWFKIRDKSRAIRERG